MRNKPRWLADQLLAALADPAMNAPCTTRQIEARLKVSYSSAYSMLRQLDKKGLVVWLSPWHDDPARRERARLVGPGDTTFWELPEDTLAEKAAEVDELAKLLALPDAIPTINNPHNPPEETA